ncbi:hypothetical protein B484DRAFT_397115 [Ochromonadaceae sp. CCMP2298]|nr:hypothetical protein B484DRAFT_397115 [Ochromonadaceae sp. CCMP2298]
MAAAEPAHLPVAEGATCMSCWDDIDASNYVEYKSSPASAWAACGFCETCVNYLLKIQWELYTGALAKTTCKAEQRRLLKAGPPINLKDVKALPCPDEAEAHLLWFMGDGQEHSAKLTGSLEGEAREKFWNDQSQFYMEEEPEEETAAAAAPTTATPATPAPAPAPAPAPSSTISPS